MYALAAAIKEPLRSAVGIMEMLWHFAGGNTPEGDIGRVTDLEIAAAVGWEKRPSVLVEALISARWLDREPKYRIVVHDWPDHCDQAVRKTLLYRGSHFLPIYGPLVSPVVLPDSPSVSPEKDPDELPLSGTAKATAKAFKETTTTEKPSSQGKLLRSKAYFDEFWAVYWRKVGKGAALKCYERLVVRWESCEDKHAKVMAAIEAQTPYYQSIEPNLIPHPATWLNRAGWEDAIQQPVNGRKSKQDLLLEGIGIHS